MHIEEAIIGLMKVRGFGPSKVKKIFEWSKDLLQIKEQFSNHIPSELLVSKEQAQDFQKTNWELIRTEYEDIKKYQMKSVCFGQSNYPSSLFLLPDPPPLLYYKGDLSLEDKNAVAIVGTRNCSDYGKKIAYRLASQFAERKITVVSGLALGIDVSAHRGSISAQGRTLAVLGSPLDKITPTRNTSVAHQIFSQGAVLSEYPVGHPTHPGNFPRRNRIIAGLVQAVIVIEAATRSGSLITARLAMEYGREVFAVPGPVTSLLSGGPHKLIQEGAHLIHSIDDVFSQLSLSNVTFANLKIPSKISPKTHSKTFSKYQEIPHPSLSLEEKKIWLCLGDMPLSIEHITIQTGLEAPLVIRSLMIMEIRKQIIAFPGQRYLRRTQE